MPESRHLTDDDIKSILADTATATLRNELELHLSQCADCRGRLLAGYRDSEAQPVHPIPHSLKAKALEIPRKQLRSQRIYPRLAAAAVIATVGLVAFLYLRDRFIPKPSTVADVKTSQGTGAYWIEKHGVVSPDDNPLAARAKSIFARVELVADQRTQPRLIMIKSESTPYAIALRDGSIVLSANALRLCYQGLSQQEGDARLAFVFGHELVHLKDASFSHYAAFAGTDSAHSSMESERKADAYGLVYSMMAGYDPQAVLKDATGFLQAWVSQTPMHAAYRDTAHPEPAAREGLLQGHLKSVADELDYFHFGVRLYQSGRYDDAILFLERFTEKFPAREVFNNLGLSHYQLAMQTLANCNSDLVQQFYAATFLDTQTLAGQLRAPDKTPCLEKKSFRDEMEKARAQFQRAMEMDPHYVPARVNLSSLHLILGEYELAREILTQAVNLKPDEPAVLNNQALLTYFAKDDSTAHSILQKTLEKNPQFAPALYNKALIEAKTGRLSESRESWNRFLQQESTGLYAQEARQNLGVRETGRVAEVPQLIPTIPLRDATSLRSVLAKMERRSLSIKGLDVDLYQKDNTQAIALDGIVELVETDPPALPDRKWVPSKTHITPSGQVQIYQKFGLEIREGKFYRIIYFE